MILQGSQKPILISMSGLLPALTLEYFASVRLLKLYIIFMSLLQYILKSLYYIHSS